MRTYAGFYECFGENHPPGIGKPRVFTGIRGTGLPNPTCFTVPAETRISGATYFCGFPGTGVPNMQCFSAILAAGGGQRTHVRFGHPSGILNVGAEVSMENDRWVVRKVMMSRSARVLMEGLVRVPGDSF